MPTTASFAPELLELLKRAAQEPVEITLNSKKKATRLCFQLNSLRKAMRVEQHPLSRIVQGVNVSVTPAGNLSAKPADSQFLDAIRAAGIMVEQAPAIAGLDLGMGMGTPIVEQDPIHLNSELDEPLPPTPGDEEARRALMAFLDDTPLKPTNESKE